MRTLPFNLLHCVNDLQGNQVKASAVSTITKSLPLALSVLVNYSLLADFSFLIFFIKKSQTESTSAWLQRIKKRKLRY